MSGTAPDAAGLAHDEHAIDWRAFDQFRELGSGEDDFVGDLIELYLADSTSLMARLKDAAVCRDAAALELTAHSLNGSSRAVGAGRMAAMCGVLEKLAKNTSFDGSLHRIAALEVEFARVRHALRHERGTVG